MASGSWDGTQKGLSASQIEEVGTTWCARPWAEVESKYAVNYCFSSAYIVSMLAAYAFPPDDASSVVFARKINGSS